MRSLWPALALAFGLAAAASPAAQAQQMKVTLTGTVSAGYDAYRNTVYFGAQGGYNLTGMTASVSLTYDAARFGPNYPGYAPNWSFLHSPEWPNFLGTVGLGPVLSGEFTIAGKTIAIDVSGPSEVARLFVENPASNYDSWGMYATDGRFAWCPNDGQCAEKVQFWASNGLGGPDLFGGQHAFDPADSQSFAVNGVAGRAVGGSVRMMDAPNCPGLCPAGRFSDGLVHWVEFTIDNGQISITPVPEPAPAGLTLAGLLGLFAALRLKRSAASGRH